MNEGILERRLWAATMLARDAWTCESIIAGRAVIAANLDGEVLHRALRGGLLPPPSEFIEVTVDMLDAIAEAGPLTLKRKARR